MADFLSLGLGLLFVQSMTTPRLLLTAWTREAEVPAFSLELPPPFRLRLSAGVAQLLRGPEKVPLAGFAATHTSEAGIPLALPLMSETHQLLGVLVLLESPPFDLEDEDFVLAWTQLKYTLLQSLAPRPRLKTPHPTQRLPQALNKGHQLLAARMDTRNLLQHAEGLGLLPSRVRALLEASLIDLAGDQGAVLTQGSLLTAFFVLPGRMDRDLLWHQIQSVLEWPEGFVARWELTVVQSQADLTRYLG